MAAAPRAHQLQRVGVLREVGHIQGQADGARAVTLKLEEGGGLEERRHRGAEGCQAVGRHLRMQEAAGRGGSASAWWTSGRHEIALAYVATSRLSGFCTLGKPPTQSPPSGVLGKEAAARACAKPS
jgi:hypothetical protein